MHTFKYFRGIPIKCDDVNYSSPEHRQMIDLLYLQICCALEQSNQKTIPSSNLRDGLDYIVTGFNDFVKELHTSARNDYIVWRNAGRPRSGTFCSDMRKSMLRFKYALRQCNQNDKSILLIHVTSPILGERISGIILPQQRKQWLSVELNRWLSERIHCYL